MENNNKIVDYEPVESQLETPPSLEIQKDETIEMPIALGITKGWTRNRILIALGITACIALAVGLGVGLGMKKEEDKGIPLDIPFLKPPVAASSPSGLKSARRRLHQVENQMFGLTSTQFSTFSATQEVKNRLFSPGPGDFTYRLGKVDERLQELKSRALESPKPCLISTPAVKFEPTLPNNEAFPMYFSCKDRLNDKLTVYFGKKNTTWYLAELQKTDNVNAPTIAVLASIDSDGNQVDTWQIMVDETLSDKNSSVLHIKADKKANTISVLTASSITQTQGQQLASTGVGCGIKLSSTSSELWIFGYPADNAPNGPTGSCPSSDADYLSSTASSNNWQDFCVHPSQLTDINATGCTALKNFTLSIFSYSQLVSSSYGKIAYNMIYNPQMPSGIVDFS